MTSQQEVQETDEQTPPSVDGIIFSRDGSLITARLNRPDGNLMSLEMCDALVQVLRYPPGGAHVLLLEGEGDSFCLGRERTASTPEDLPGEVRRLISLNEALLRSPLVTVAKVQGDAAGFGVGLASLMDVSVTTKAAKFSFPEVKMDLAPTLVLAWLPRVVGRRQAFWLTATGQVISGVQAVQFGLINDVVDTRAELDEETERRVRLLLERSPRVHTEIRSMLRSASTLTEEQSYDLSADRLVLGSMRRRMS